MERERAQHPRHQHGLSLLYRLGLVAVGIVMIVAGVLLLTAGGPGTATRLGRVAGIVILLGIVALAVAAMGHV